MYSTAVFSSVLSVAESHRVFLFPFFPLYAGESLQVTVQPASIVQKLGGPVILGCVVDPPRVNLTWRLNGKELAGSDEVLGIHVERGKLIITALNNRTVGRYQCIARVPEGVIASVPAVVTLASEYLQFSDSPCFAWASTHTS